MPGIERGGEELPRLSPGVGCDSPALGDKVSIYTACMYHLESNFSEMCTCNNTAPRRPTYGTPAVRGPMDISHGISVFL